jgi:hypothetical protein
MYKLHPFQRGHGGLSVPRSIATSRGLVPQGHRPCPDTLVTAVPRGAARLTCRASQSVSHSVPKLLWPQIMAVETETKS